MAERALLISCSIFRGAFRFLPEALQTCFEPVFLDSMLHMRPTELALRIEPHLEGRTGPTVFLYGDCSPRMRELTSGPRRARVEGINCARIFLGRARYGELLRSGSFFLLPEWTGRWREVFRENLGFSSRDLAREFMRECARRLSYLDTGECPVPKTNIFEASDYLGLPWSVERVGTVYLEVALREALGRVGAHVH